MMDIDTVLYIGFAALIGIFWLAEYVVRTKLKSRWSISFFLLNGVLTWLFLGFVVVPRAGLTVFEVFPSLCLVVLIFVGFTVFLNHRRHNKRKQ